MKTGVRSQEKEEKEESRIQEPEYKAATTFTDYLFF
jgi:hypothetical protein